MNEEIEKVIRTTFKLQEDYRITEDMGTKTITEWDSLGHLALISALEEQFQIKFTFEELLELETVASIKEIVAGKVK